MKLDLREYDLLADRQDLRNRIAHLESEIAVLERALETAIAELCQRRYGRGSPDGTGSAYQPITMKKAKAAAAQRLKEEADAGTAGSTT
jgi:hypothetical protein